MLSLSLHSTPTHYNARDRIDMSLSKLEKICFVQNEILLKINLLPLILLLFIIVVIRFYFRNKKITEKKFRMKWIILHAKLLKFSSGISSIYVPVFSSLTTSSSKEDEEEERNKSKLLRHLHNLFKLSFSNLHFKKFSSLFPLFPYLLINLNILTSTKIITSTTTVIGLVWWWWWLIMSLRVWQ